jgi:hypothetical protein
MAYSVELVCQDCGGEFTARRRDAKRCGACAVAARAAANRAYQREYRGKQPKPTPGQCMDCGTPLIGKRKDAQRCWDCSRKRSVASNRVRKQAARPAPLTHTCILCGQRFEGARKDLRRCPDCLAARVAKEPHSLVTCIDCGSEFKARTTLARRCPTCKAIRLKSYQQEYEKGKRRGVCVDCSADIGKRALRCHSCDNKARSEYMRAERNANWKGGRSEYKGYVFLRVEGEEDKRTYRGEHILNWERANNIPLPKGWVVHHLNGIKDDNRIPNLAAMPRHLHHTHPREALKPYERRIRELEQELREVQQIKLNFKE